MVWLLVAVAAAFLLIIFFQNQQKKNQQPQVIQQPYNPYYPQQQVTPPQQQQPPQQQFPFEVGKVYSYTGPWVTVKNRKLDGIQTADVKYLGNQQWAGTFHGTWHGVSYSYDVQWTGPPENLNGTASIDGANYTWTGIITPQLFTGQFQSGRYTGNFNQKRASNATNQSEKMFSETSNEPSKLLEYN